jgi:hypothetical protein
MKLNKKKELYVNAIVGGNMPSFAECDKMRVRGLMSANIDSKWVDGVHNGKGLHFVWNRSILIVLPARFLVGLYRSLNE